MEVTGAVEVAVGPRGSPALTSSPRIVCSVGGVVSVGFVGMQQLGERAETMPDGDNLISRRAHKLSC